MIRYMQHIPRAIIVFIIGILAVVPFFTLEWYNTNHFSQGVPWVVFIALLLYAVLFTGICLSALKDIREQAIASKKNWFILKFLLMFIVAWLFVYLVVDQMPCFLGAKGC